MHTLQNIEFTKQNGTQEMFFRSFSHGVIHFMESVSFTTVQMEASEITPLMIERAWKSQKWIGFLCTYLVWGPLGLLKDVNGGSQGVIFILPWNKTTAADGFL